MRVSARTSAGHVTRDVIVQIGGKLYSVGQNCVNRHTSFVTLSNLVRLKKNFFAAANSAVGQGPWGRQNHLFGDEQK
jgi:hypothetical protein